jgi:hypothetical protein
MTLFDRLAKGGIIIAASVFSSSMDRPGYDTRGGVACARRPSDLLVVIVDWRREPTELGWLGRHPE